MALKFENTDDQKPTILAALRQHSPDGLSWSAARKLLNGRRITINSVLCSEEGRRLGVGEVIELHDRPVARPPSEDDVRILFVDSDLIVAEKPSGMETLRRASEKSRPQARRLQRPTLDECVPRLIRKHAARRNKSEKLHQRMMRLFSVHRIDRDSSGLLVLARNESAQTKLIAQFAEHAAVRKYFSLIPGTIGDQTIRSQLIRDRGDGLRGSTEDRSIGQEAVTHIRTLRQIHAYSELQCTLETGRTNQIRIHLAEAGHPICGDIKYRGPLGVDPISDDSGCPRLALHAAELRFEHPHTRKPMEFTTPWPQQMQLYLNRLNVRRDSNG